MFGTLRKHQKWLWVALIFVTAVSFIVYFTPSGRAPAIRSRGGDLGSVAGRKVDLDELWQVKNEVRIGYWLTYGNWPDYDARAREIGFDENGITREAYKRILLIRKAEEMGIVPSAEQVAMGVKNLMAQIVRANQVDPLQFERAILLPGRVTLDDFARFVRHNIMINNLATVVGSVGGCLTPEELERLYEYENREIVTVVMPVLGSNFLSRVSLDPKALAEYYSNHIDRYTLPERVQVRYVHFAMTNYIGQAWEFITKLPDFSNEVERAYARLQSNNVTSGSPEEIKGRIVTNYLNGVALDFAKRSANAFGRAVFDHDPITLEVFLQVASTSNLSVNVTPPFSRSETPPGLNVDEEFVRAAFRLTSNQPVSEPVVQADGVYILALEKRLSREVLPLDAVRERVEHDLRWDLAVKLAQEEGVKIHAGITNGLRNGKTFDSVCAELRLGVISPKPFARRTQILPELEGMLPSALVRDTAFKLRQGECSEFVPTVNGGFIVYVKDVLPVDRSKMQSEMGQFRETLLQVARMELFQAWFRELARVELASTPVAQLNSGTSGER